MENKLEYECSGCFTSFKLEYDDIDITAEYCPFCGEELIEEEIDEEDLSFSHDDFL